MTTARLGPGTCLKQERYELEHLLGEGGFGATWSALDRVLGERVAIKCLNLGRASDWKAFELFEREVSVLQSISCEQVPSYIDYFESEEGSFCLVQQLAPGHTIAHWVRERGWRPDDETLVSWLLAMLDVLEILHGYSPAIIHRDIKPQNVLRDDDGAISVVDFGSVKAELALGDERRIGGSTMVGTFGYMAPEQLRGVASPATDLYGLAMTTLYIMTHREPGELPTRRLKIDLEQVFGADWQARPLLVWLDGMIEPAEEDRFISAQQARHALLQVTDASRGHIDPRPDDDSEEEPEEPVVTLERIEPGDPGFTEGMAPSSPGCGVMGVIGVIALTAVAALVPDSSLALIGVLHAIPLGTLMIAASFASNKPIPSPHAHIKSLGVDVASFAFGSMAALTGAAVFTWYEAPLWGVLALCIVSLLGLLMGAMYRSTQKALRRQVELERLFGMQWPIVHRDQDRDVRIAATSYARGKSLVMREAPTFTAPTLAVLAAVCFGFGMTLSMMNVHAPYDVLGAACGISALCFVVGALWTVWSHWRDRATIRIDRATRTIKGRAHAGRRHTVHFDQIRGWEVFIRKLEDDAYRVVICLDITHDSGAAPGEVRQVEIFGVEERSEALAGAQVVMWQRLLDELIDLPAASSGVVLDFAQAEQLRQSEQDVRVRREVAV